MNTFRSAIYIYLENVLYIGGLIVLIVGYSYICKDALRHLQFGEINEKLHSVVNTCKVAWGFIHFIERLSFLFQK